MRKIQYDAQVCTTASHVYTQQVCTIDWDANKLSTMTVSQTACCPLNVSNTPQSRLSIRKLPAPPLQLGLAEGFMSSPTIRRSVI